MRKLKLDLDALAVESFEAEGGKSPRGTVVGRAQALPSADAGGCDGGGGGGGTGLYCDPTVHYSCYQSCYLYDTCATQCYNHVC